MTQRILGQACLGSLAILITAHAISVIGQTATGETCGTPQMVYGRVTLDGRGVRAAIDLAQDTMDIRTTQTNPFGYYKFFDVQPCLQYSLVVRSKHAGTFPIPRIIVHSEPVEVNIAGTR